MTEQRPDGLRERFLHDGMPVVVGVVGWLGSTLLGYALLRPVQALFFSAFAAAALASVSFTTRWSCRRRSAESIRRLGERLDRLAVHPLGRAEFDETGDLSEIERTVNRLARVVRELARSADPAPGEFTQPGESGTTGVSPALTQSGLFDSPSGSFQVVPGSAPSVPFSTTDMVNRLEPKGFHWLESSAAEQDFLGWNLRQLREKSFLEIVHPEDVERVGDALRSALVKGEVHGLILRIRSAVGKPKAIEMNIGARYGSDTAVSHLRCHITDVTAKVRAERDLRLRTRELTQVNEQLRLINRELEDLKERYRDLYQNAPTMYFSIDDQGRLLDCNDTLLRTLGYRREALVGRSYDRLLPEALRPLFPARFAEFLEKGSIEVQSQWVKANGEVIDVWVTGWAVRNLEGRIVHSRSVAQDVTSRNRLEAQLNEKNRRLAQTNDELSRKNKEMDEFTYVVSHDLQEPLRTLTAFSDFLMRDYGQRLEGEGQEFVRYIVDASRRMRALIHDLLRLSRAGKVTAEFASVNLEEVASEVRADLAELIRSTRAEVEVKGPLPVAWGDHARIGQLLANLIGNGLKYNDKPAPHVELGVHSEDSSWINLYVRDDGIGIEPRFHDKIFQLFRRLHTREQYEGNGAGLAICTKIVEAHGGRIWLESAPGQGSTFFVSLPRPPADNGMDGEAAVSSPQGVTRHAT